MTDFSDDLATLEDVRGCAEALRELIKESQPALEHLSIPGAPVIHPDCRSDKPPYENYTAGECLKDSLDEADEKLERLLKDLALLWD